MTVEKHFVNQDIRYHRIEEFLKKDLRNAGFSSVEIKRTPLGTRILIRALRPGLVIGSGGENVKRLTGFLEKRFKLENPHIEIDQVANPDMDPTIVAWRITTALEKGQYFKKVANILLDRIMKSGAKGAEIRLSGRLPSARAKTWKFIDGNLRKCGQDVTEKALVAYDVAHTRPGVVGIKVTIIPPEVRFPDELIVKEREKPAEPIEEKVRPAKEEPKPAREKAKPEKKEKPVEKKETKQEKKEPVKKEEKTEKKPAEKKTVKKETAKKPVKKTAEKKAEAAEKKPAKKAAAKPAKKTAEKKPAAKPAAKKPAVKKTKPAAKKPAKPVAKKAKPAEKKPAKKK